MYKTLSSIFIIPALHKLRWSRPILPVFRRQRQEDQEFKGSYSYLWNLRPLAIRDPVSKKTKQQKTKKERKMAMKSIVLMSV